MIRKTICMCNYNCINNEVKTDTKKKINGILTLKFKKKVNTIISK